MSPPVPDRTDPLLRVTDLKVGFPIRHGFLQRVAGRIAAVDGVGFEIHRGETVGLVGESGSGKTTLGKALLRLLPVEAVVQGSVEFDGIPLLELGSRELRATRRRAQMVFQDPYGSLNPRMRVTELLSDPLRIHGLAIGGDARIERVEELLRLVGLEPNMRTRFPYSFSGGQRQRLAIAKALAVEPTFVVCDEPVTALDVSVQAQILNLLAELQQRLDLSYLFIAHDLGVVRYMSDRVGVMYLGRLMEIGSSQAIYESPAHPYTYALLSANPVTDPDVERGRQRIILEGDIPSPASPPPGCRFHTRCWLYQKLGRPEDCRTVIPELRPVGGGTTTACHHAEDLPPVQSPPLPRRIVRGKS